MEYFIIEFVQPNNGNFMVSIHIVPIAVILIISIVCFIFRFKRGASLMLVPRCKGLRIARIVETSNAESPTPMNIYITLQGIEVWGQRIFPVGVTIFKNKELPVYT